MSWKIFCFGVFEVFENGSLVSWKNNGGPKAKLVLKALLTEPNAFHSPEKLIDWIWGERLPENPGNALRNYIWQLRKLFEPDAIRENGHRIIRTSEDGYYGFFVDENYSVDVDDFRSILAQASHADNQIELLEQAVSLYRGPFLKDDLYEDWTQQWRDQFEGMYSDALMKLGTAYGHERNFSKAIKYGKLACDLNPSDEALHRNMLRWYGEVGDRSKAITLFENLKEYVEDELGVELENETVQLYQSVVKNGESLSGERPLTLSRKEKRGFSSMKPWLLVGAIGLALVFGMVLGVQLSGSDDGFTWIAGNEVINRSDQTAIDGQVGKVFVETPANSADQITKIRFMYGQGARLEPYIISFFSADHLGSYKYTYAGVVTVDVSVDDCPEPGIVCTFELPEPLPINKGGMIGYWCENRACGAGFYLESDNGDMGATRNCYPCAIPVVGETVEFTPAPSRESFSGGK